MIDEETVNNFLKRKGKKKRKLFDHFLSDFDWKYFEELRSKYSVKVLTEFWVCLSEEMKVFIRLEEEWRSRLTDGEIKIQHKWGQLDEKLDIKLTEKEYKLKQLINNLAKEFLENGLKVKPKKAKAKQLSIFQ